MKRLLSVSLVLALVLSLLGCGGSEQDELVVYNGRNEALVDSLVQ
ncbi:MAG: iron ABC transporter substrate-binding protein, partial [Bacteroidetes bacterium QS_3_64_15]